MEPQGLIQLYTTTFGQPPAAVERLKAAGSNRQYYRLSAADGTTYVGVVGTSVEENEAFYNLSLSFAARHLPVPSVCAMSPDRTCYLQQDLGSTSLFDFLQKCRHADGSYDETGEAMLTQVMTELPAFQFEAACESVYRQCYPMPYMDAQSIQFDLNYFKYCYLKLTGLEFNEIHLESDFQQLTDDLLAVEEVGFMYRDFQARNVMLFEGRPYYIDFQGGRRGPIYYDVASFLWQASAAYPDALKMKMVDVYLTALKSYMDIDSAVFMQRLQLFVFFRMLQVLGAYGFRGLWERKEHFIKSIPLALDTLRQCVAKGTCDAYPYLKQVVGQMLSQPASTAGQTAPARPRQDAATSSLQVDIYSFSYKKGIPSDPSGNGGGYVFDCRSTNNPGRYEQYKQLTGLDQPVIDFLEEDGEILPFLESVYRLADFHVQRYIDRGFTHLQFAFGCTGGQHRSVYSAQHLAQHLFDKFAIRIHLYHREQNISQHFIPQSN